MTRSREYPAQALLRRDLSFCRIRRRIYTHHKLGAVADHYSAGGWGSSALAEADSEEVGPMSGSLDERPSNRVLVKDKATRTLVML